MTELLLWDMAGGRGMGVGCSRVEDRNVSPETGGGRHTSPYCDLLLSLKFPDRPSVY